MYKLQNCGIVLIIPEGAVEMDTALTIGACMNKSVLRDFSQGETPLSPVIWLEPHGFQFKEPIALSIQHSANMMKQDSVQVFHSATTLDILPEWKNITSTSPNQTQQTSIKDSKCPKMGFVDSNSVTIFTQDLCMYVVMSGESGGKQTLAKEVAAILYGETVARGKEGEVVRLTLHLVDNLPADKQVRLQ